MVTVAISTDSRYPVNRKIIRKAVFDIFKKQKLDLLNAEVSVAIVGSRKMKALCDKYLNDGKIHEIISFPLEEATDTKGGFINPPGEPLGLGDIVLCWPLILLAAIRDNILVDEETYLLIAHGVEHLLGKHHE